MFRLLALLTLSLLAAPAASLKLCSGQPIPAGYVITALSLTTACKTGALSPWNTMTVTQYEGLKAIRACAPLNQIPSGYLITARTTTAACKGGQGALVPWNTMTLTLATGLPSVNACMPVSPPAGYAVTARLYTLGCAGPKGVVNTATLKRL
jgi:uncharacterized caspase-like protein